MGGARDEPSKWPQKPFASTASRKRIRKIAQFSPVAWRLGTDDGRASESEAVVTVVIAVYVRAKYQSFKQSIGAHNLLSGQKRNGEAKRLKGAFDTYHIIYYKKGPCTIYQV
jgi:hypothetical protein